MIKVTTYYTVIQNAFHNWNNISWTTVENCLVAEMRLREWEIDFIRVEVNRNE